MIDEFQPISIARVAEFGATMGRDSEYDHMTIAYLTVRSPSGDMLYLHINSAHTATELAATLLDVANSWPDE